MWPFKKKKETEAPGKGHTGSEADSIEMTHYKRKKRFYGFAFQFLPKSVFGKTGSIVTILDKGGDEAVWELLQIHGKSGPGPVPQEDLEQIATWRASLADGRKAFIIGFPGADAPTGDLMPILAPFFVGMVYKEDLSEMKYFVLTPSLDNRTNLREINAQGMNINCGDGGEATPEAFLKKIEVC